MGTQHHYPGAVQREEKTDVGVQVGPCPALWHLPLCIIDTDPFHLHSHTLQNRSPVINKALIREVSSTSEGGWRHYYSALSLSLSLNGKPQGYLSCHGEGAGMAGRRGRRALMESASARDIEGFLQTSRMSLTSLPDNPGTPPHAAAPRRTHASLA